MASCEAKVCHAILSCVSRDTSHQLPAGGYSNPSSDFLSEDVRDAPTLKNGYGRTGLASRSKPKARTEKAQPSRSLATANKASRIIRSRSPALSCWYRETNQPFGLILEVLAFPEIAFGAIEPEQLTKS
jgi:hypothetical protein